MFALVSLLLLRLLTLPLVSLNILLVPDEDVEVTFEHLWDRREDRLTITFEASNVTLEHFRYYYFDFRPFADGKHLENFPRQRLIDQRNSLNLLGLHENDYVSCVTFIDEFNNVYKPRHSCYEFTLGEKTVGSHHRGSSGYLSPLLVAVVFVIHVFIAVVHHIKKQQYAQRLLQRFIAVNSKDGKRHVHIKHSLKQLDQSRPSISIQRRLSRVSIDATASPTADPNETPTDLPSVYTIPRRKSTHAGYMKTIPENQV